MITAFFTMKTLALFYDTAFGDIVGLTPGANSGFHEGFILIEYTNLARVY
jgi:hypothetical protein